MCNTLRLATHATYVRLPYIIANNNVLILYFMRPLTNTERQHLLPHQVRLSNYSY